MIKNSFFSFIVVSTQVRSINYQLSNLKYIQQGWTFRPSNVVDFAEMNLDEVEFNLTSPDSGIFDTLQKVTLFFSLKINSLCFYC